MSIVNHFLEKLVSSMIANLVDTMNSVAPPCPDYETFLPSTSIRIPPVLLDGSQFAGCLL